MKFSQPVPVFRIFDQAKANEFYVDFLGFKVAWIHRFEEDLPAYMEITRAGLTFHLTEHFGDGCPGSSVRIEMDDLNALHAELIAKRYKHARPDIEDTPWGTREMSIHDPFGNRLTFVEAPTG